MNRNPYKPRLFPQWVGDLCLALLLAALIAGSIYGAAVIDPLVMPRLP